MGKKSSKTKKFLRVIWAILVLLVIGAVYGYQQIQPVEASAAYNIRFNEHKSLRKVLDELQKRESIKSGFAMYVYARLTKKALLVKRGTYQIKPGSSAEEIFKSLEKPIRVMVRIPEFYWIARTAAYLEEQKICTAAEYTKWANRAEDFQPLVEFPLPKKGSLEGYLYPDTYDIPPLMPAQEIILRQLQNFKRKVVDKLPEGANLRRALIVGSMVQLEVKLDEERPIVAGVIENRVAKKMPLQIDATVLYGLQEWRRLYYKDYYQTDSPYNTYRNKGLPPGPICSPTDKSIFAALKPAQHPYLYYVALPDGKHLFSSNYDQHRANIKKRKAALTQVQQ